ncbi:aminotransferase class I/II-fold pyridoxal phosphate-dependent enzyme [Chitinophaga oryziterrae]|uniref:Aminotransferase n=1 Tax=Chitinophaga oryziterrae TaxID=1031224 RepID=A0A6N8JCN8_9BACT|nr:histidinol-phosphate transaminase [Chitinophaga oryziterrae]MVT42973.1 aminotransferase class I/II-fold pyridoxal phosphate-dependent enzyme [Chitinophaga oryziterrae]
MLNGHGDDGYLFGKEIKADFSSNVFYEGLADGLRKHLSDSLYKLNNYPEVNAQRLQKALATWHNLIPEQVLVTNGATEAFYLIAHAYRNSSATIITPAFAEYEDACVANDMDVRFKEWEYYPNFIPVDTSLVFLGNPNNPTGNIVSPPKLWEWIRHYPDTIFVLDEAYADFTKSRRSMVQILSDCKNLIIVKSLTKTYSIPGLRLGYLLGNAEIIQHIQEYKMPWSVNALAIEAGLYIIEHAASLALPVDKLLADTASLMSELKQYVTVFDTQTNFFLCQTDKGTAAELKSFLLHEYGVLIRDASNFRTLTPKHFRVATQSPEKNALLVKGIAAWTKS